MYSPHCRRVAAPPRDRSRSLAGATRFDVESTNSKMRISNGIRKLFPYVFGSEFGRGQTAVLGRKTLLTQEAYEVPVGCSWGGVRGGCVGRMWGAHGVFVGSPRGVRRVAVGWPWDAHE